MTTSIYQPLVVAGPANRSSASSVAHHVYALSISLLVIFLAPLMRICADGRVAFRFLPDHPLPDLCLIHRYLNMPCPGCGLTRSIISLSRGHWELSLYYHRLGWMMAIAIVAQIPYRCICLKYGSFPGVKDKDARVIAWILFVALILNWVLELS